ncbi:MAG: ABC transporter permease [Candidatus Diapherotrites archaeon]|uniref:ABC transporter permease n=1 Tax=Candidatus Iainarchaeum sp. TaxID=3101447 RepID=A0A939CAD4_9ARCH|nr:ABC transporter permease [Candidatus Diapherotrites archaeon]
MVLEAFVEMLESGELFADLSASASRLFVGFLLGTSLGIVVAIFTAKVEIFNDSVGQLLHFSRFIPPLALVPLAVLWLGIGEQSKVGLIMWAAFFPVWLNTIAGVRNIERKHLLAAKNLGAGNLRMLKEVVLPSSAPFIVSGSRIGLGFGFSVLIAAEMAGAFSGLGFRIALLHDVFRIDKMIADIIVLGLLGLAADRLLVFSSKKLLPWLEKEDAK